MILETECVDVSNLKRLFGIYVFCFQSQNCVTNVLILFPIDIVSNVCFQAAYHREFYLIVNKSLDLSIQWYWITDIYSHISFYTVILDHFDGWHGIIPIDYFLSTDKMTQNNCTWVTVSRLNSENSRYSTYIYRVSIKLARTWTDKSWIIPSIDDARQLTDRHVTKWHCINGQIEAKSVSQS